MSKPKPIRGKKADNTIGPITNGEERFVIIQDKKKAERRRKAGM